MVHDAVDCSLSDDEGDRRFERALAALGRFRSGVSDVSAQHDRYLDDVFGG